MAGGEDEGESKQSRDERGEEREEEEEEREEIGLPPPTLPRA